MTSAHPSHHDELLGRLRDAVERNSAEQKEAAFEAIYRANADRLLAYIHNKVRSKHDAEEISSIVWAQAWNNLEAFAASPTATHFFSRLTLTVRRTIVNHQRFRHQRPRPGSLPIRDVSQGSLKDPTQHDPAIAAEVSEALTHLRDNLDLNESEILDLRIQGHSTSEIASKLNIPTRRVERCVKSFRHLLHEFFPGVDRDREVRSFEDAHETVRTGGQRGPATPRDSATGTTVPHAGGQRDVSPPPHEVLLGASCPRRVQPGRVFTARFAAYIRPLEETVRLTLRSLTPDVEPTLALRTCRWTAGLKVTVSLTSPDLTVDPPEESFSWNGDQQLLDFVVRVQDDTRTIGTVLRFDVIVGGFTLARICLDVAIDRTVEVIGMPLALSTTHPSRTAFASYASADRLRVLDRIAEIKRAGVDVFTDCLSLFPGDAWKPKLEAEISNRELFLLFWSRNASKSEWVEWEWRTALSRKGINSIQPHPLETMAEAVPPSELESLHFEDCHMLVRRAYAESLADHARADHAPQRLDASQPQSGQS